MPEGISEEESVGLWRQFLNSTTSWQLRRGKWIFLYLILYSWLLSTVNED
jgi:hypothetical protein